MDRTSTGKIPEYSPREIAARGAFKVIQRRLFHPVK
jgi:hypothetical protein